MTTKKAEAAPEQVDGPVLVDNTDQPYRAPEPAKVEEVKVGDVVQVNYL